MAYQCSTGFPCCDRIPEIVNSQGRKVCLAHGFRSFSPCSLGPVVIGPVVKQYSTVEGRRKKRGWSPNSFEDTPPIAPFTRPRLLKFPPCPHSH
jgi:hypothetical protein